MIEVITQRLNNNIARVENLVGLYQAEGKGRRGTKDTDVLRAALVLLHAGLEDYLRSLLIWKVPEFSADTLKEFRVLMGDEWKEKVTLSELHELKGKTIDEVITASITANIRKYQTFSDVAAVKKALGRIGIAKDRVEALNLDQLRGMIERRHLIVHHADRNENAQGQGNHKTISIGRGQVNGYLLAVTSLRDFVSGEVGGP